MTHEGKFDPTVSDLEIGSVERLEDFVKDQMQRVHSDTLARIPWLHKQAHFYRRRYAREFRGTDDPWPGASDYVLPLIDLEIERQKPVYLQSTLATRPIATVMSFNPRSIGKTHQVEFFLEWQFKHRDKNYPSELSYGIDYLLQFGHVVWKIGYDYRTRRTHDVILHDRLPPELQQVLLQGTSEESDADIQSLFGKVGLTRKEIKRLVPMELLERLISTHFKLHPDDPDDKQAIGKIAQWVRSGTENSVVVKMREVIADHPVVTAPAPERFIVPPWISDIARAPRIAEEYFLHEDEIDQRSRDGRWIGNAVDLVLSQSKSWRRSDPLRSGSTSGYSMDVAREQAHDDLSGRTGQAEDTIGRSETHRFVDLYTHFPVDRGKQPEKVRLTIHPDSLTVMQAVILPFAEWPYVKVNFEYSSRAYYHTRGIPEKLNDLEAEATAQKRFKLNRMTIQTNPTLLYRTQSLIDPELFRFVPGLVIPVTSTDDVRELTMANYDFQFDREVEFQQRFIERYMGSLDSALTDTERLTRPRTAREINAITDIQSQVLGPRLLLFQLGQMRVMKKVYDLWMRFGPNETWAQVTGASQPVRLTRAELEGDFDFIPTPASLANPAARVQEAKVVLDTLSLIAQNETALQSVTEKYEFNLAEAIKDFLNEVNWRRSEAILRRLTPQEIQARQQQQGPPGPEAVPAEGPFDQVAQRIRAARGRAESGQTSGEIALVPGGA